MPELATRDAEVFDLETLITLLSDAYTASYRDSSLKVRRRYRKLITALTQAKAELDAKAELGSCKQAHGVGRRSWGD